MDRVGLKAVTNVNWARPTIQKLVDKGLLQGNGNGLGLTDELLRILVINDRAGLYDAAR